MAEIKFSRELVEVRTVEINCKCPNCNTGYLRHTGETFVMLKQLHEHKCEKCGHLMSLEKIYPQSIEETSDRAQYSTGTIGFTGYTGAVGCVGYTGYTGATYYKPSKK